MKKLYVILLLAISALFTSHAGAVCAPTQTPPITTGTVGYQSQTRYISAIGPHPSNFYSLRISWSINGVRQSTETISFGANSAAVMRFGQACESPFGEATAGTGDCATADGWHSTGNSDRAYDVNPVNTGVNESSAVLLFINGLKIAELGRLNVLSNGGWHWNTTGLTKIASDGGTSSRLTFSGYDNGSLVTHQPNWFNDCGTL